MCEDVKIHQQNDEWCNMMIALLKGKGFNSKVLFNNVKNVSDCYPIITFDVKVDELQLDFAIEYLYDGDSELVRISVSSPNRKGSFTKKATGKNTTPLKVYGILVDTWNGKYKK